MKRKLLLFTIMLIFIMAKGQEVTNIRQWIDGLEWKTPKMTGIKTIDEVYEQSDELYKSIKAMGDSVPMYSLRSIVENGDTVAILVVDQYNKPYDSFSAFSQIVSGTAYIATISDNAAKLTKRYGSLITDLPNIVKSKGLGGVKIIADATKTSKKVGKIYTEFLPQLKTAYEKRGNPIKAYCKAQSKMSNDDGFVTTGFDHVPEFNPGERPTDDELDLLLENERNHRNM